MPPNPDEAANLAAVQALYAAIRNGPKPEAFEALYDPGILQEEFPNRLLPNGARRDLAGLREAANRGAALMARQSFELLSAVAMDDLVAVEGRWEGTVGSDIGPFKAGMVLRTRFAQVFTFRKGKVVAIRNYDCFEPW